MRQRDQREHLGNPVHAVSVTRGGVPYVVYFETRMR